jgi:hypothetical protein
MTILVCILLLLVLGAACVWLHREAKANEQRYLDLLVRYRQVIAPSPEDEATTRAIKEHRQVAAEYRAMMAALYDGGEEIIQRRADTSSTDVGDRPQPQPRPEVQERHE